MGVNSMQSTGVFYYNDVVEKGCIFGHDYFSVEDGHDFGIAARGFRDS